MPETSPDPIKPLPDKPVASPESADTNGMQTPTWIAIVGIAFLGLAILLLFGLIIAQAAGKHIACSDLRPYIILVTALCVSVGGGFLGGWAKISGSLPLPKLGTPLQVGVGGAGALFLIVTLVMNYTFVCPDPGVGPTRTLSIIRVEDIARPGKNLTVDFEAKNWPDGSRLVLDYSDDKTFQDLAKTHTEPIGPLPLNRWTFQMPEKLPTNQLWAQLRVLGPKNEEFGKSEPPTIIPQ